MLNKPWKEHVEKIKKVNKEDTTSQIHHLITLDK